MTLSAPPTAAQHNSQLGGCAGSSSTFLSAGSWSAAHAPALAERRNSYDLKGPAEEGKSDGLTLYERGVPSDLFTLILQGKSLIYTGEHTHLLYTGDNTVKSLEPLSALLQQAHVTACQHMKHCLKELKDKALGLQGLRALNWSLALGEPLQAMQRLLCPRCCFVLCLHSSYSQFVTETSHTKDVMDLSEVSPLFISFACRSTLGNRSLSSDSYTPDFTAVALNSAPFRMLRISRSAYRAALEATQLSPVVGYQVHLSDQHRTGGEQGSFSPSEC